MKIFSSSDGVGATPTFPTLKSKRGNGGTSLRGKQNRFLTQENTQQTKPKLLFVNKTDTVRIR